MLRAVASGDAARDHLKTKVAPALTDAPLRYQTLVAAHVLGVVTRDAIDVRVRW